MELGGNCSPKSGDEGRSRNHLQLDIFIAILRVARAAPVGSAGRIPIDGKMLLRLTFLRFTKGFAAAALAALGLWLLAVPAQAQFWDWGGPRRYDPFRDLFAPRHAPRERTWSEGPS